MRKPEATGTRQVQLEKEKRRANCSEEHRQMIEEYIADLRRVLQLLSNSKLH